MKITKLEYQKKDPKRVNVYVDDNFVAGMNLEDVVKIGLSKDQEISQKELNRLIDQGEFGKLFNFALNFLTFRPRSEWEVRTFLAAKIRGQKAKGKEESQQSKKDSDADVVDRVIERLRKIGQVNDEEFAKWYLDQRRTFRPEGKRAIRFELSRKGVARNVIDGLLKKNAEAQESGEPTEFELATRAIHKRVHSLRFADRIKTEPQKVKIQVQRFLASRGFDWETINEVVEKIFKKRYNGDG